MQDSLLLWVPLPSVHPTWDLLELLVDSGTPRNHDMKVQSPLDLSVPTTVPLVPGDPDAHKLGAGVPQSPPLGTSAAGETLTRVTPEHRTRKIFRALPSVAQTPHSPNKRVSLR